MGTALQIQAEKMRDVTESLRPDLLFEGHEPEARTIYCGLSWSRYLALDAALGDDRPGPRFYYLDGNLEIMSVSDEHERLKTCLGDFLADYFLEHGIEVTPRGQATMRLALKEAGAEPDESWCVGEAKLFPDLVLEIALTSGGLPKPELYRRFVVREVWFWRQGRLEIHALLPDGSGYERAMEGSRLLPELDVSLLEECAGIFNWGEARRAFRAGLAARR